MVVPIGQRPQIYRESVFFLLLRALTPSINQLINQLSIDVISRFLVNQMASVGGRYRSARKMTTIDQLIGGDSVLLLLNGSGDSKDPRSTCFWVGLVRRK